MLDVTIRGGHVQPVAEQFLARGIPFVLAKWLWRLVFAGEFFAIIRA